MSYSTSDKAVQNVSHYLSTIASCKGDSVSWSSPDAVSFAYQLRQAITICHNNKERWPDLYRIKNLWRIKVRANTVTASRIVPIAELQETDITPRNFIRTVSSFDVPEVREPLEVIGAIMANMNYDEYLFSDYIEISDSDLNKLYKWTSKNEFYIVNSKYLIITRHEPKEGIQWIPTLRAM